MKSLREFSFSGPTGHIALGIAIAVASLIVLLPGQRVWAQPSSWFAGSWDSHMYVFARHPQTIGLRVEVVDSETGRGLPNAEVRLEGEYEEWVGAPYNRTPVTREYRLSANTNRNGVAVFGLSWHTGTRSESSVDELEKIQRISVRARRHSQIERPFNLSYLLENDRAWMDLVMETPGAKYFVLLPGPDFEHYEEDRCQEGVFFEAIRDRGYGVELPSTRLEAFRFDFIMSNPQQEAGPFIMIPVEFRLQRIRRR